MIIRLWWHSYTHYIYKFVVEWCFLKREIENKKRKKSDSAIYDGRFHDDDDGGGCGGDDWESAI